MLNAIGYIRVSTEAQAGDDRYGIDVQRKAISEYAEKNGFTIVDWRIDTISGAKDDRPEMDKILYGDETSNPPYQAVIVFKNDRVARDTKLYFYYFYTLEKKNIKLLSTEEHFAEGDEFANIYRSLLMFVAEQERKNIALRTSKGRSIKAQCGGYSGGRATYGYRVVDGVLVVNDKEAEVVKKVFLKTSEGLSMLKVAEYLNDEGYRSRSGGRFYASTIKSILSNEMVYKGFYKYGDMTEYVKGVHEAIL